MLRGEEAAKKGKNYLRKPGRKGGGKRGGNEIFIPEKRKKHP